MHGDLGLHVLRHAAQEPKLAQDQRTDHTMVVVALDPRLILLLAIQNAALKRITNVITFKAYVMYAIAN